MTDDVSLDERGRRRAMNEAVFRVVNERLHGLNTAFATFSERFEIVCECDDAACIEQLSVETNDYEAIRSDPALFAIAPNHDSPAVETVVDKRDGYHVVRKKEGDPARLATATDPRAE